jgi:PmbA protein
MTTLTAKTGTDVQTNERLTAIVEDILQEARRQGATAAEAEASVGQGLSVTVRLGEVETVEHNRDKGLAVTVYFGHKSGSASTSDFSAEAVRDTVRAACTIAKYTAEDPYSGLADPQYLAKTIPNLDLDHPWAIDVEGAIALARDCEEAARAADTRITNSEGGTVFTNQGMEIYGNSDGFLGTLASTRHSVSCAVVGQDASGMQRDYWFTLARDPRDLESAVRVGVVAAERTVRRLGARKLKTAQMPVVFEASVAASLLSHFSGAIRGGSLYRRASFLLDQIGQPVFAPHVHIYEQPHLLKGLGSTPFDNEGVATRNRDLVKDGVLLSYLLDSYSARKLGLTTTGNAGGAHNLTIETGKYDLAGLLKQMGRGLFVTELIGFGVNNVTGDYSRGAAGFWVENGEIQYPVEEITVAGNLKQMYRDLAEVGTDVDGRGNIRTGSILIANMTVAGS